MPTLKQVMEETLRRAGLGLSTTVTGTTTTLIPASNLLTGPFPPSRFPIGTPVTVTAGGTIGDNTYVNGYVPATGTLTVSPAITTGATAVCMGYGVEIEHFDRVKDAINRVMDNRAGRWQRQPLTFVTDGDMVDPGVTSWTSSSPTHLVLSKFQAAFPDVMSQHVLRATGDADGTCVGATITSTSIQLPVNASVAAYQWYFQTAIRVPVGTATATITLLDQTNSVNITTFTVRGSATATLATNSSGTMNMVFTANIPATCKKMALVVTCSAASSTIDLFPVVAFPMVATTFPLSGRILSDDRVGNFFYGTPIAGVAGMESMEYSEPITLEGRTHHIAEDGDHMSVTFNFRPLRPVYFDEYVFEAELSAMTDTTTFPLDYLAGWSAYELLKWLDERFPGTATTPGKYAAKRRNALIDAKGLERVFGEDKQKVVGRV